MSLGNLHIKKVCKFPNVNAFYFIFYMKKGVKILSLKVTTFSSKGRATRIYGHKTKRIHHLQSDNQLRVFLLLEWNDKVKDIKENAELRNLESTIDNLEDLRIDKFSDVETGKRYELHTNFLITIDGEGGEEDIAISVKGVSELERKTVIEKMEIERRYWSKKEIKFFVITEQEIDKQLVDNIKWVREALVDKTVEDKREISEKLYYFLQENRENKVSQALQKFDEQWKLQEGTALFMFRHLIGLKEIEIDMKKRIDLNKEISDLIRF